MMKNLFIFSVVALIMSCNAKRHVTSPVNQESPLLKSELYFNNCDSTLAFLKTIIVNNHLDKNLKNGYFRIPFINASYENANSLFPEKCFVGIPVRKVEEIFGKWEYGGTSVNHPAWYILQNRNKQLAIEIFIRSGIVEKFKVTPSTVEIGIPVNKNR